MTLQPWTCNVMSVIIRALAAWRLAHLFMYEAGPWNIVLDIRRYFGVRHEEDGTPYAYPDGSVFACFLCFSVWTGLVSHSLPASWLRPFALSALAIWAEKAYKSGGWNGTR